MLCTERDNCKSNPHYERAEKLHQERELVKKQLFEAENDLKRENPYSEEIEAIKKELSDIDSALEARAKEVKLA